MKEIAILLNTKNRNEILIRILNSYISNNFKGTIYIGNASSLEKYNELDKFIKSSEGLKIKHYHFPKYNKQYLNGVTIQALLKFVEEKYVIVTGDDDLINLNNLNDFKIFLNNNKNYSCCHGFATHYDFDRNLYFDKIKTFGYEKKLPSSRILELSKNYTVLQFSLIKADALRFAYEGIENILDPLLVEVFVILKILVYGKSKNFNRLHILRGFFSSKKYVGNNWEIDNLRQKQWHISINYILEHFDKISKENTDSKIFEGVKLFISEYYIKQLTKRYSSSRLINKKNIFKNIYELLKKPFIRFEIIKLSKIIGKI